MNDRDELLQWIQCYADGTATQQETMRLQSRLQQDADARKTFRAYMTLDAALSDLAESARFCDPEVSIGDAVGDPNEHQPQLACSAEPLRSPGMHPMRWVALVVACSFLAVVWWWSASDSTAVWATVTETGPCVLIKRGNETRLAQSGESLRTDERIVVNGDGAAQVRVRGLGVVSLGPEARLCSAPEPRIIELTSGFASVVADKQAANRPWRIRTPQVEATVLGTDFNIASSKGRTALRVSEGVVRLMSLQSGQSHRVSGGNRAYVTSDSSEGVAVEDPTHRLEIASSRSGSVLLLTSREPLNAHWERFNQIVINKLVSTRMWRLGFRVEVQHYETVTAADLANRSLIILSLFDFDGGEEVIKQIELSKSITPVLCLEPAAFPVLGMTAEGQDVGFGFSDGISAVEFIAPSHPLSKGLSGKKDHFLRGVIGWGRPADGAARIACLPGRPDKAVVFGYDTGDSMTAFPAPARRVGLFLDPTDIRDHLPEAWAIFDAAVDWCVSIDAYP